MCRSAVLALALVLAVSSGCGTSEDRPASADRGAESVSTTLEEQALEPPPRGDDRVEVAGVEAWGECFVPHEGLAGATISLRNSNGDQATVRIHLDEKVAARVVVAPGSAGVVEISDADACFPAISVNGRTPTRIPVQMLIE